MFYDLDWNKNSSSNDLKSQMEDFKLIKIMFLKSDEGFGSGKNMCWIFVQNPMQMDLVQYKVLHIAFYLIRIWTNIAVHVIKHIEIGLNLENGVLFYSSWKLFILLDGAYFPHLLALFLSLTIISRLYTIISDQWSSNWNFFFVKF
jgi:hypothetical protein